tara:strand:+ start:16 stop:1494 length:1479 start_codon:yes stop_codon:yes gene_type:complete
MSYRNPARIVDTQSGQHYRNMQQSLAKSFTGVIDADTTRLQAQATKAEKEQAALRNKLEKQEEQAYKTANQANLQAGTSVRYDNMQENLNYNAHLARKSAANVSLTSEEKSWKQNFANVGTSIQQTLANVVSIRDSYTKQKEVKQGQEGSIAATDENVLKQQAVEIWLNGNGGTSHSYYDGTTGETTLIAKDLKGKEVGRITSNGKMYEFEIVPSSAEGIKANTAALLKSIKSERASSPVFGENPKAVETTVDVDGKKVKQYYLEPSIDGVKEQLKESSKSTVMSWSPSEMVNWWNATQKNNPEAYGKDKKFMKKEVDFTEAQKYVFVGGVPTDDINPNVQDIINAFTRKTVKENPQLMDKIFFANDPTPTKKDIEPTPEQLKKAQDLETTVGNVYAAVKQNTLEDALEKSYISTDKILTDTGEEGGKVIGFYVNKGDKEYKFRLADSKRKTMENILRFNGGLSSSQIVQQLDKLFPVNKEKGKLDGLNKKG